MGKRTKTQFQRSPRDFYPTPPRAAAVLLPHIKYVNTFVEPCAGAGHLMNFLISSGKNCVAAFDIEPMGLNIKHGDARGPLTHIRCDAYITNPPWSRGDMHEIIYNLSLVADTWLLIDADWMHTKQARPMLNFCKKIVSVGRVKWISGSKHAGMDNVCWYLFGADANGWPQFFPREEK